MCQLYNLADSRIMHVDCYSFKSLQNDFSVDSMKYFNFSFCRIDKNIDCVQQKEIISFKLSR